MAETDPRPGGERTIRTIQIQALYRRVCELAELDSASNAGQSLVAGDIQVAWPESVKTEIASRIKVKAEDIEAMVARLKNAE